MRLLTNFPSVQKQDVEFSLKLAKIEGWEFREAFDCLGNPLPGHTGLFIPESEYEDRYKVEVFYYTSYLLCEEISQKLKELGIDKVAKEDRAYIRTGLTQEDIEYLRGKADENNEF